MLVIRPLTPAAVALNVLVVWGFVFAAGGDPARDNETQVTNGPQNIDAVIEAGTDLLGEIALNQADGPTYEFFADLMPPLRYVNAAFRQYPLVLAAPRNGASTVGCNGVPLMPGGGNTWHDVDSRSKLCRPK